mgnify:CR=1 FL=1
MNNTTEKLAFTFWDGPQLSLLNILSLLSFARLNPNAVLTIYTLGGDLDITQTQILTLPENLKVGGDLSLYDTQIKILPSSLQVGHYIYDFSGDKESVPSHLKSKLKN